MHVKKDVTECILKVNGGNVKRIGFNWEIEPLREKTGWG
jgi:hypothetical protein